MSAAMSGTRLRPQPIHNGAAHRHRAARARSAPPVSCQPRLARIPFDPAICRDGILPEILFGSHGPFGMKVLLHDLQNLRVSPQRIAVRPVTAIDQPVRAEDIPDCVESAAVEVRIERHPARHAAQHSGNLDVDLRTFAELPQVGGGRIELWQVIHDDAQVGNAIGQPRHIRYQRRRGIGGIERQAGLGQRLESADEFRLPQFRAQIPAPQVAIPDTSKQRVARETFRLAAPPASLSRTATGATMPRKLLRSTLVLYRRPRYSKRIIFDESDQRSETTPGKYGYNQPDATITQARH